MISSFVFTPQKRTYVKNNKNTITTMKMYKK